MPTARYISPPDREKLLGALSHPRDRLLVVLGLNTGFRISELLSLRWKQLLRAGEPVAIVEVARKNLKGGRSHFARRVRSRLIPLNAAAAAAVKEYAFFEGGSRGPNPAGHVFRSRKRFPGVITRRHAREILVTAAQRAGLAETIAPHVLRRCFAEDAYRASGHDILAVRDLLGHASVLTTEQYLRPRKDTLHEIVQSLGSANQTEVNARSYPA